MSRETPDQPRTGDDRHPTLGLDPRDRAVQTVAIQTAPVPNAAATGQFPTLIVAVT
jgi:hypothetical protein